MTDAAQHQAEILVAFAVAMAAALLLLFVTAALLLAREKVKEDLRERILEPLSVRWAPFAPGWLRRWWFMWGRFYRFCFRVRYRDPLDQEHEALCCLSWRDWRFRQRVIWLNDTSASNDD